MNGLPKSEWVWMGHAAHFILSHQCRFHLATYVGGYLVSTVGEYVPAEGVREMLANSRGKPLEGRGDAREADWFKKFGFEEVGFNRKYETYVFNAGPSNDCPSCPFRPTDYSEVDGLGSNDSGEAYQNHLAMCEKWAAGPDAIVGGA